MKTTQFTTPTRQPTPFESRVYGLCAQIPLGQVSTYQAIAHALGCRAYRAVGQALNKNPYAPKIPCHRVVSSTGELGGFAFGLTNKISILETEGVHIHNGRITHFENVVFTQFKA